MGAQVAKKQVKTKKIEYVEDKDGNISVVQGAETEESVKYLHLNQKYVKGELIPTEGNLFKVYKCHADGEPEKVLAVKEVRHTDVTEDFNPEDEIEFLRNVRHPHCVVLRDCLISKTKFYIIQEYLAGPTLKEYVKTEYKIEPKILPKERYRRACLIMQQVLSAIKYLHRRWIVHHNLNTTNIVFKQNPDFSDPSTCEIKIVNFATSNHVLKGGVTNTRGKDIRGSEIAFVAPEICKKWILNRAEKQKKSGEKAVDMWSVGVIGYLLAFKRSPFYNANKINQDKFHKESRITWKKEIRNSVNGPAVYVMKCFLERLICPWEKRMTVDEAIEHPWLMSEPDTPTSNRERKNSEILRRVRKAFRLLNGMNSYLAMINPDSTVEMFNSFVNGASNRSLFNATNDGYKIQMERTKSHLIRRERGIQKATFGVKDKFVDVSNSLDFFVADQTKPITTVHFKIGDTISEKIGLQPIPEKKNELTLKVDTGSEVKTIVLDDIVKNEVNLSDLGIMYEGIAEAWFLDESKKKIPCLDALKKRITSRGYVVLPAGESVRKLLELPPFELPASTCEFLRCCLTPKQIEKIDCFTVETFEPKLYFKFWKHGREHHFEGILQKDWRSKWVLPQKLRIFVGERYIQNEREREITKTFRHSRTASLTASLRSDRHKSSEAKQAESKSGNLIVEQPRSDEKKEVSVSNINIKEEGELKIGENDEKKNGESIDASDQQSLEEVREEYPQAEDETVTKVGENGESKGDAGKKEEKQEIMDENTTIYGKGDEGFKTKNDTGSEVERTTTNGEEAAAAEETKAEAKAKVEVETKAKVEAASKTEIAAQAEAEAAKVETETATKAEAETAEDKADAAAKAEAEEAKAKAEAAAKAEAEAMATAKAEVEAVAKAETEEAKAKVEAVAKAEAEAIATAKAETEAVAKAEAEATAKAAAKAEADEAEAKAEAVAKAEDEAMATAKAEAEAAAKAEAEEAKAKVEAVAKAEPEAKDAKTDSQDLGKLFDIVDANNDNVILKKELRRAIGGSEIVQKYLGIKRISVKNCRRMFARMDENDNGKITKEEFIAEHKTLEGFVGHVLGSE